MAYGTLTTLDTLASLRASTGLVVDIGEDVAWESIQAALDAHNQLLQESLTGFVDMTTDQLRRYGGPDNMVMEELDEFATPGAQKIAAGVTLGFPLKLFGGGLQWTRTALQNMLASELAAQATAMLDADIKNVHKQLKLALFTPTNYTFEDRRVAHVNLPIKALVNADSAPIPIAPDGTTFNGATHTHYLGTASCAAEVWIKPWIPANYVVAVLVGSPQKALAMRTRMAGGGQLNLEFENEIWPLRSKGYSREFGFGVWNRVAAACLLTNNATYSAPATNLL